MTVTYLSTSPALHSLELNSQPVDYKSEGIALTITPPSHPSSSRRHMIKAIVTVPVTVPVRGCVFVVYSMMSVVMEALIRSLTMISTRSLFTTIPTSRRPQTK